MKDLVLLGFEPSPGRGCGLARSRALSPANRAGVEATHRVKPLPNGLGRRNDRPFQS